MEIGAIVDPTKQRNRYQRNQGGKHGSEMINNRTRSGVGPGVLHFQSEPEL